MWVDVVASSWMWGRVNGIAWLVAGLCKLYVLRTSRGALSSVPSSCFLDCKRLYVLYGTRTIASATALKVSLMENCARN